MLPSMLLLEKILSYKERSPLIAILDEDGQSSRPLLRYLSQRATQRYCLFLNQIPTIDSGRNVVYLAFEAAVSVSWIRMKPEIHLVRGLKNLEEAGSRPSALQALPAILKEISKLLSSSSIASSMKQLTLENHRSYRSNFNEQSKYLSKRSNVLVHKIISIMSSYITAKSETRDIES